MSEITPILTRTGELLDQIIVVLERRTPTHSETLVWYSNNTLSSFNIEGEFGSESIPDKENAVKIEIGNTVTSIMGAIFIGCSGLTSITIPSSVTSIGNRTFRGCSGLTTITIPSSVTSIGTGVFSGCSGLMSVTIPDSVTSIGDNAFNGCSGLTSIAIPSSVTSIGGGSFSGCSGLTSITIPDGVTSIGNSAFADCSALSSIISRRISAPTVQSYTFGSSESNYTGRNTYSTGNNVLKVPQGATGYDTGAWIDPLQDSSKCGFHIEYIDEQIDTNRTLVKCIDGTQYISKDPPIIKNIGYDMHDNYHALSAIKEIDFGTNISCINQGAFSRYGSEYGKVLSNLTKVSIPGTVKQVYGDAFNGQTFLSSVILNEGTESLGQQAFANCSLFDIVIPQSVIDIGYNCFKNNMDPQANSDDLEEGEVVPYLSSLTFIGKTVEQIKAKYDYPWGILDFLEYGYIYQEPIKIHCDNGTITFAKEYDEWNDLIMPPPERIEYNS